MGDEMEFLAAGTGQVAARLVPDVPTWDWPGNPRPGDPEAWKFYVAVCAQMCGTGTRNDLDTLSCRRVWEVFFDDWSGDRVLWDQGVSTSALSDMLAGTMSKRRDGLRRAMLRETRFLCRSCDPDQALFRAKTTFAYGEDPFWKKLNLLKNALFCRADIKVSAKPGPVIDYHVMRVACRVSGKGFPDETECRAFAMGFVESAAEHVPHHRLDAFLWSLGREVCRYGEADCLECPLGGFCRGGPGIREPRVDTFRY